MHTAATHPVVPKATLTLSISWQSVARVFVLSSLENVIAIRAWFHGSLHMRTPLKMMLLQTCYSRPAALRNECIREITKKTKEMTQGDSFSQMARELGRRGSLEGARAVRCTHRQLHAPLLRHRRSTDCHPKTRSLRRRCALLQQTTRARAWCPSGCWSRFWALSKNTTLRQDSSRPTRRAAAESLSDDYPDE